MSLVISDTTPLHYLILIGQVGVLPQLFGSLLVPPAVIAEMQHLQAPSTVRDWALQTPVWVEIRAPISNLGLRLGRGENEAISLAVETEGAVLLIDDLRARIEAQHRNLVVVGTIGILDLADERGLLDFEAAISQLLTTSFHIENTFLARVKSKVRARKTRER